VTQPRCRGDSGQVGGIEALPFGLLIFVVGSLLIANAWAVVDAKFATDAAARQAVRTFVEGDEEATARDEAIAAGLAAIESHGRDPDRASIAPIGGLSLTRCARITFAVEYHVPALSLPFIGGYGDAFHVRSTHSELVDPYRNGVPGSAVGCR